MKIDFKEVIKDTAKGMDILSAVKKSEVKRTNERLINEDNVTKIRGKYYRIVDSHNKRLNIPQRIIDKATRIIIQGQDKIAKSSDDINSINLLRRKYNQFTKTGGMGNDYYFFYVNENEFLEMKGRLYTVILL